MHILHLFLSNGINPICVGVAQVKHPCSKTPTTVGTTVGTTEPTTEGTTEGTTEPTTEPTTKPAKCGKFLTILQNAHEGGGEGSVKSHFIKILLFDIILILIADILAFLEISTLFAIR